MALRLLIMYYAFTNNVLDAPFTTLYSIDTPPTPNSPTLLTQSGTETGGILALVTALTGLGNSAVSCLGFDISNDVFVSADNQATSTGLAVAILNVAGVTQLYEIDLVTGSTVAIGAIPSVNNIVDLAVGYREIN